ncbi:MAG: hypothetical protein H7346_16930 [Burkholderiaceae bacterium]|nr:hypothetical protein [Burkholderiaceae bacterium]
MSKPRIDTTPELPTPLTPDPDDTAEVFEDGLVPPTGISDDPEFERVVNIPD